jgi:hypothetical protein
MQNAGLKLAISATHSALKHEKRYQKSAVNCPAGFAFWLQHHSANRSTARSMERRARKRLVSKTAVARRV